MNEILINNNNNIRLKTLIYSITLWELRKHLSIDKSSLICEICHMQCNLPTSYLLDVSSTWTNMICN